jgi:hypothetical protein
MPQTEAERAEYKREWEDAYRDANGLSSGAIAYRRKKGIPLDWPVMKGGRHRIPRKLMKAVKPGNCAIVRAGTGVRCEMAWLCSEYNTCLSYATQKNWRGWEVKGGLV